MTIPTTLGAGILTYAWPFANSTAALIVITLLYGFCSGTYVALLSNPILNFGGEGDVGRRVGMFMTITALGAVAGPPISGAINEKTGGFEAVGLYAGQLLITLKLRVRVFMNSQGVRSSWVFLVWLL